MIAFAAVLLVAPVPQSATDTPKALDPAPATTAASATEWVPMTLHLDRYVYLRGTLNGCATDIVLDSGAGATVIDAALADRLGLESDGAVAARGVGGTQPASFLTGAVIEVGGLTIRDIRPVKIDLSGVGAMLGRGMPVILGREAFERAVIDLDYPNSRVAFRTATGFSYAGAGESVPLVASGNGHRQVEVTIEGKHKGLCTVDTGSGGTLAVFQAFVDEHDLLANRAPLSETESGGVGGRIRSKLGTLRSVTFAGYELSNVPATFGADKRGGAFDNDRLLGNLGGGVFSRFRLIFDYSRDLLHVEPAAGWQTRPFRRDRLGLACQWEEDALVVKFVPPGSPAATAGLAVGTRIVQLGGKPIPADRWRETVIAHTGLAAGTEVTLRTVEGRELRLIAADYY